MVASSSTTPPGSTQCDQILAPPKKERSANLVTLPSTHQPQGGGKERGKKERIFQESTTSFFLSRVRTIKLAVTIPGTCFFRPVPASGPKKQHGARPPSLPPLIIFLHHYQMTLKALHRCGEVSIGKFLSPTRTIHSSSSLFFSLSRRFLFFLPFFFFSGWQSRTCSANESKK